MNPAKISVNATGLITGAAVAVVLAGCVYSEAGYGGAYGGGYGGGYVEIGADSDFDEPLSPYGQWEVVGAHGRCWVPRGVGADWRPYCNGEWVSTDDGWYFESDEPWGWATYHYGRWVDDASIGWCWIPGTQWGPAWVSWWEGDGYIGWAPLGPGDRYERGRFAGRRPRDRDCVFVAERRFTERIRPTNVEHDNAVLFNRTTSVTNIRVVNNVTVNAGPRRENIERASGRTIRTVPARDVRRQREAPITQRPPQQRPSGGENVAPARGAPPRSSAIAPAVPRPVTPPPSAPPPAVTHRETTPVYHPAPTTAPGTEGNANVVHPRPAGNEEHRTVTPSREAGTPPVRVAPSRPAGSEVHAPPHVNPPAKPAPTPKAQPAPKGEGEHREPKGEKGEQARQQQNN